MQARVWLAESALGVMREESAARFPLETGGVLIGYCAPDWSRIVVVSASGPGQNAVHETKRFAPDADFQAAFVAKGYRDSGRVWQYLGDWHSHPQGAAAPSWIDKKTLRNIARDPLARVPKPLMVILAGAPNAWEVAAWQLQRGGIFPKLATATLIIDGSEASR